jgi:hypothetical protein
MVPNRRVTYLRVRAGAHPEFFIGGGGGADPETVYNLFFILKSTL